MEIEEIRQSINELSESEAKSILLHFMLQVKMMQKSKDSPEEILENLNSVFDRLNKVSESKGQLEKNYSTVHLVCGESPAGSLRSGLGGGNKIIAFPDFFAVGPIWHLHKEVGRKNRHEWLKDHLNDSDDFLDWEYKIKFSKTVAEIEAIGEDTPIVIWTAENANEQVGLLYFLYLLKEKSNEIFVINTTHAYQKLFKTFHLEVLDIHTGEINGEQLKKIYEENLSAPLTASDRKSYEREWVALSESRAVARLWEDNKINTVTEDYFDDFIVKTARDIHRKQTEKDFIKSARLIGEVYGTFNHIGDAFLEYRVRSLIYNGVFEIKGIPKGMRYYSVKLK